MNRKRWSAPLLALAFVFAFGGLASAVEVEDFVVFDGITINKGDDPGFEWLEKGVNPDTGLSNSIPFVIEKGDLVRGVFTITSVNDNDLAGQVQWAGIFSLRVADLVNRSSALGLGVYDTADIVFGPDPDFASLLDFDMDPATAGIQPPDGPALGTNTKVLIRMWQQTSGSDLEASLMADRPATLREFAQGAFFWDIGFADPAKASHADAGGILGILSENGEGWVARADRDGSGTIEPAEMGNLLFGLFPPPSCSAAERSPSA